MSAGAVALVAAAVFLWGTVSGRLERADITAPIVFVAVGVLIWAAIPLNAHVETQTVRLLTEVTLVWVLFGDAARVGVRDLRADASIYLRLLALALPLTVVLGWLLAWGLVDGLDLWLALLVGAALAPTDAALSAAVITNPQVPERIRRILNVESGLNDGIVTPVVFVALAGAATTEGVHSVGPGEAALELLGGVAIGVAVGAAGGRLLRLAQERRWVDEAFGGPAVLALALLAYACSLAGHGNGFVAAFVAGIAFGHTVGEGGPGELHYVEVTAGLASVLVWLAFGAAAVPLVVHGDAWQLVLYAVLSLTLIRMLPVVVLLRGSGLSRRTAVFIGWFGPRGLASVVFTLLAVEELGPQADTAVAVLVTTILMSVLAHGASAAPLAARFGAGLADSEPVDAANQPLAAATRLS